jgi:hypothetical protein
METNEEGDSSVGVFRNLHHLSSPSLRIRLSLLDHVQKYLQSDEIAEAKPGPLRKWFRAITTSFLDEQYDEQTWTNALVGMYQTGKNTVSSFDLAELVWLQVQDALMIPHKFATPLASARVVELCTRILSLFVSESTIGSAWVKGTLTIIAERSDAVWALQPDAGEASAAQRRAQAKVGHFVGDMLRSQPVLLRHCLAIWFPNASPTKAAGSLCGVLLAYTQQRQPNEYPHVRQAIVEIYAKRLQAVTKPQSQALASPAWYPLVHTLIVADWIGSAPAGGEAPTTAPAEAATSAGEGIESLLVKLMKKAPESASYVTKSVIEQISPAVDTSAFVTQAGAAAVIKMLKSGDASVRAAGLGLTSALAVKTRDPAAHQLLVAQLFEGYLGKGAVGAGGLQSSQAAQKRCVLYALSQCAAGLAKAVGAGAAASLAVSQLASLQTVLDKEVDANIRHQAAHTLGMWLRLPLRGSVTLAAEDSAKLNTLLTIAKTHLDKPQGANNPLGTCYLLALAVAVNSGGVETDADLSRIEAAVSNGALNVLKEAVKKPTSGNAAPPSAEVVLALHVALRLARSFGAVQTAFDTAKLWAIVSAPASVLYSPALATLLTTSPASCNSTGVNGTGSPCNVLVTAATVADGTADALGTALLCAEAVRCLAASFELVATEHGTQLSAVLTVTATGDVSAAARALASYAVYPADAGVREAVCKHLNRAVSVQPTTAASVSLLQALWAQLTTISAAQQRYNTERIANYKSSADDSGEASPATPSTSKPAFKAPVVPAPARWQAALLACVSDAQRVTDLSGMRSAVRTSAVVSHLAFVAAHPLVSPSPKAAAHVWQSICAKLLALFGLSATIDISEEEGGSAAAEALAQALAAVALGEEEAAAPSQIVPALIAQLTEAAVSDVAHSRTAAQNVLYLLSDPSQHLYADKRSLDTVIPQLDGSILSEHVFPALLPLLDVTDVNALTEAELLAYSDPSGAIAGILADLQRQSDATRSAESVVTNADRKKTAPRSARRGNFGADSTVAEDLDWAERVRSEKAQAEQKARSEGGSEYEDVKRRVHAMRADVARKVDRVLHGVALWQSLTVVNVSNARLGVILLLERGRLAALLRSPVVGARAHEFLLRIVNHVIESDCASYARYVNRLLWCYSAVGIVMALDWGITICCVLLISRHQHYHCCNTRDLCDSLRLVETHVPSHTQPGPAFASDEEGMDAYRALYQYSGPLLRLLQSLLMLLSRSAAEHRGAKHFPVQPSTFLLLYPVLRGVLLLPHVMPGTEHTFHLLDRWVFSSTCTIHTVRSWLFRVAFPFGKVS